MKIGLVDSNGRQAWDRDVKALFGLSDKSKWPDEGMPKREIQGLVCWVEPKAPRVTTMRWGREVTVKSSKHRAFCICPVCGETIPLGRIRQHAKIHA